MKKNKRILVDMTCSIIHHGHIRILKKASKLGRVIVGLTKDKEILKYKKFKSPLNFNQRKEIVENLKFVSKVIPANFFITEKFLVKNKIDYIVHGTDNKNKISKKYIKIFKRTPGISSSILRKSIKEKF